MPVVLPSSGWGERVAGAGTSQPRPVWAQSRHLAMRLLIVALLALLGFLQYRLWVGEGSLAEVHGLKQEIGVQEAELERLRARNRELQAEVDDLRTGLDALEERARGELGMIKPGEIFIQVIAPPKPAPAQ